ncbi:MAG: putative ABC transporter periplasmic-binding protein [Methanomassiliicoccales archaeon PtaU1.Bin124]|nr:MAG: putative ABC transporter periplasmic-binding protein [Methanomassiliicoccales archaeon PtaU1.Bin124]
MEGSANPLPEEKKARSGRNKMIVIAVVIILLVVAVGAYLVLSQKKDVSVKVSANKTTVTAGASVTFNASQSSGATSYFWKFGDGTFANTTDATTSHAYTYPGLYLVVLKASNSDKSADNLASPLAITVNNPDEPAVITNDTKPKAVVAVSANQVKSGTVVQFDASASLGYEAGSPGSPAFIASYTWNFGDGSAAQTTTTGLYNKTFTGTDAIYCASVTLTSTHGAVQTYKATIIVSEKGSSAGVTKTFVEETTGDPDTLDPAVDYETAGGEVLQNVYETLIWYNGSSASELVPQLATNVPTVANGGITNDNKTYTFHLREGVYFHDGTLMTAADVEYSLERVLTINDPNGPAWMMGQVMVNNFDYGVALNANEIRDSVVVIDDYTVQINLVKAYPAFIYVLAFTVGSIVSMDFVEAHGGVVSLEQNEYMKTHTCGTGPFKLVVWDPSNQIVLERNNNYWRTPAKLNVVIIKQVTDFNARLLHLQKGTADCIYVPRKNIESARNITGTRIIEGYGQFAIDFLGMNQNIQASTLDVGNIPSTFFADVNVRKAFVHAFDYQTYLTSQMMNTGKIANGPIPEGMVYYDTEVGTFTYNLTLAAQYLNAAINPATGHSWLADGFTITCFYNSGNTVRQGACEILKAGLEQLSPGITVNVQALAWPTYLSNLYAGKLSTFCLGWSVDYADPDDFVQPFLLDGGTYGGPLGFNDAALSQKIMDAAFESNSVTRGQLYHEITQTTYDNATYLWLAQATNFHIERSWISGYFFNPMYSALVFYTYDKVVA